MEGLHPGFLLKRFENEGEFSKFQEQILDSPTQCGFSELIDDLDERPEVPVDNNSVNGTNGDESVARGPGVVDGGADGIFLSMKNVNKMWKPNEPTVRHSFTVGESGYYFLFYQICLMGNNEKFLFKTVRSTFRLDFEYKNFDVLGKASYLTAGEMPLPHMYLYFSISYAMMLFLWVRSLKSDESRGGAKPTVYAIHHLMSSVVALKFLSVFFESVRYHFIRVNGHAELWVSYEYWYSPSRVCPYDALTNILHSTIPVLRLLRIELYKGYILVHSRSPPWKRMEFLQSIFKLKREKNHLLSLLPASHR